MQLSEEVNSLLLISEETPENFTGKIIFMSMFNDISFETKDNEKECESNANLVSQDAIKFGHFLVLVQRKSDSIRANGPQGERDRMADKMMLEFGESGHPIFRVSSPLSRVRLKSKGHGKLSIHHCADLDTIETVFRNIIYVKQLSLCGAVAEMCEEDEILHDRTGQPVVDGQSSSSFVPSVINTEVPLDCDDFAHTNLLLQQYGERIERLSQ